MIMIIIIIIIILTQKHGLTPLKIKTSLNDTLEHFQRSFLNPFLIINKDK